MEIELKETKKDSCITISAYEAGICRGEMKALTDSHHWGLLYDVRADSPEVEQILAVRAVELLPGQEIFYVVEPEKLSLYENMGFRRAMNIFTYVGAEDGVNDSRSKASYLPIGFLYDCEHEPVPTAFPGAKKSDRKLVSAEITYSDKPENIDYERVNEILSLAFGSERDMQETKETFENSQYRQFAYENGRMVACARAISDGTHAQILNVAVDPAYQGLHLGTEIIQRLAGQMKGQTIVLSTHPGGVGFYNREKGFRRNKTGVLYRGHDMPPEIERRFTLPKGYRFDDEKEGQYNANTGKKNS